MGEAFFTKNPLTWFYSIILLFRGAVGLVFHFRI
jgi:hypothetical protein